MSAAPPQATPAEAAPAETTLAGVFLDCVRQRADAEALRYPTSTGWASLSWHQLAAEATELAAGLLALGVGSQDRVAIAGTTGKDWILADLGVLLAGAATTAVYPNTLAAEVAYILADSGSVVAIVEDAAQLAKIEAHRHDLPALRAVVLMDAAGAPPTSPEDSFRVLGLADLADLGRGQLVELPDVVERAVAGIAPDHLSTLIYTSGTTGRPKGVRLTQAHWVHVGRVVEEAGVIHPGHVHFLWLPLAHVFGKLLLATQWRIGFLTVVDGRIERIVDNLAVIRPTFMAAAPRIFEKVHGRVVSTVDAEGGARAALFRWAFSTGIRAVRLEQAGQPVPATLRWQRAVADRLVFAKIRARLGGRIETLVSGSAALSPQIAEWFAAAGLPIMEGYGMTESCGASFVNRPDAYRIGSVGTALGGTEVRIADDGEILMRSPGVMQGYHHLPDETAAALLPGGWLATGDVGELDADGFLRITDRKKDLVKTSGGKYIAPSRIEGALKAASALIGQVVVIADGRRFPAALITLDPDALAAWAGARGTGEPEAVRDQALHDTLSTAVDVVNAGLNNWERVKRFLLVGTEWTVESGELTPSLKVRRAVVLRSHQQQIDDLYADARPEGNRR